VAVVEFDGGGRGITPLPCRSCPLLVVRNRGDHLGELAQASGQQGPRVAVVLQDRQAAVQPSMTVTGPGRHHRRRRARSSVTRPAFGATSSAGGRGAFAPAPLASMLKVDSDSSDGEGCGADSVPLCREHFDIASCRSRGHGCLDLGSGIAGHGGRTGPKATSVAPAKPCPLMVTVAPIGPEVGLTLDMVAS